MRMLNQLKTNKKLKRSHILILGSLFIFFGMLFLSWDYLIRMRGEIFSDMNILMMDVNVEDIKELQPEDNTVSDTVNNNESVEDNHSNNYVVDYSKYLGVLEIPKIGLKRGFYGTDSKYNNIKYNVTMVEGSTLPDVVNGNLILIAHSGDSYISFFAYLYRLEVGDVVNVTYKGVNYQYEIVNIYMVPKTGAVKIIRNRERTTLTMVTCTKDNDYTQTVYIAELVG